jgi:hypothetical protein
MTKNLINTQHPIEYASGGTGTSSLSNQYGVIYATTSSFVTTSAGTAGQVFTSAGSGSAPYFATSSSSGSGGWKLLQTQPVGGAPSVSFISQISSTYSTYVLTFCAVTGTSGAYLPVLLSQDNGNTWVSSGYVFNKWYIYSTVSTLSNGLSTTNMGLVYGLDSPVPAFGIAWFYGLGISAEPIIDCTSYNYYSSNSYYCRCSGALTTAGTYNAIQIAPNTGSFGNGVFSLYGVQQ